MPTFMKYAKKAGGGLAWARTLEVLQDPYRGFAAWDDFLNSNLTDADNYDIQKDGSAAVALTTDEVGGVISLTTGPSDNNEIYMGPGNDGGCLVRMTKDSNEEVWFEIRCKVDQIASGSFIAGLATPGKVAADLLADGQTDAAILDGSDPAFVGFIVSADTDADGIDAAYRTVGNAAHTVHSNNAHVFVADEYVCLGVTFDGQNTIRYWVNGVQTGTDLLANTAEVPDNVILMPIWGVKASAATAKILELDWWTCGMTINRTGTATN